MPRLTKIDRIAQGDQVVYYGELYIMNSNTRDYPPQPNSVIMLINVRTNKVVAVPINDADIIYKYDHYTTLKRLYKVEKRVDKDIWRIMEYVGERWDQVVPSTAIKLSIKNRYYSYQSAIEAMVQCRNYEEDRYEDSSHKWETVCN